MVFNAVIKAAVVVTSSCNALICKLKIRRPHILIYSAKSAVVKPSRNSLTGRLGIRPPENLIYFAKLSRDWITTFSGMPWYAATLLGVMSQLFTVIVLGRNRMGLSIFSTKMTLRVSKYLVPCLHSLANVALARSLIKR